MKAHKHAELIKAWADGAEIQYFNSKDGWTDADRECLRWIDCFEYRIKPEPKPDFVAYMLFDKLEIGDFPKIRWVAKDEPHNCIAKWDGETGDFKSAEVFQ